MKIKAFFTKNKERIVSSLIGLLIGSISVAGLFTFVIDQITLPWDNKKDIEKIYIILDDKVNKEDFKDYKASENGKWKSIHDKVEVILVYTKPGS